MKTVKEVSEITGISIRTLRYYDEIGLLKPTHLTEAGYRLYDDKALARLQEIMFFKELDIPLKEIKEIMEHPNYDREQILVTQKFLLERKRNRLNGIIELIDDRIRGGVKMMDFEKFNEDDVRKILDHSLELQSEETQSAIVEQFGSIEAYRENVSAELLNEKTSEQMIKIYGSKDKAVNASLQADGSQDEMKRQQEKIDEIYHQFSQAMKTKNQEMAMELVDQLAESYKVMFRLDNARYLLLETAKEYLEGGALADAADAQYGAGAAEYIGNAIKLFYGE